MKRLLKAALARTPFRVIRRGKGNRFNALEEALSSMKARGFSPAAVIDGGANVGDFSEFSLRLFPNAIVYAIEPQSGCQAALEFLRLRSASRLIIHSVAICGPAANGTVLTMVTDERRISTGAHVASGEVSTAHTESVPCITLDSLLARNLQPGASALLKLDLQGYELEALAGAITTLKFCDAVLTEVSFFSQAYEPSISALVAFLANQGFELYDIAGIYARPRDDRPRQGDFIFARRDSPIVADMSWS